MAVKWTKEQQQVIDTRGRNILVSAAAGSGKTAVLVARILAIVTDETHPVDIDRMLVLTFTNAAAAEMRERVRDALEQRAEEEPDNAHLQRQLVLIHNAKITTIHSFCLQVLRSHFQTAGIDPSFRVADEGEILLMEQEAVQETVEAAYEKGEPEFLEFLEAASPGKSDRAVEEMVLQLYHFSLGQPWPKEWLHTCRTCYASAPLGSGKEKASWVGLIEEETARLLRDARTQTEEALRMALEADGPYMYEKALQSDLELIERLAKKQDYVAYAEAFYQMGAFARLSSKKDAGLSEEKRAQVQAMRSEVKDLLASLRGSYYYDRAEALEEAFLHCGVYVRVLTQLAEEFAARMEKKKAEKNILDFGDLEHLALRVLVERVPESEQLRPTAAALEYAETFEEIMTDEYQDSNLVQELILNSVSGRAAGEPNRFMVGDVKQSIYRFRLARPELFLEKYRTYKEEDAQSVRIDLHRNFRSRAEVLLGVNHVFRRIMTENLGQIAYDEDAALYPGAVFVPYGQGEDVQSEPRTGDSKDSEAEKADLCKGDGNGEAQHMDAWKLCETELHLLEADAQRRQKDEARLVGLRIRELVGRMPVWDKEMEAYRPLQYRDVVILLRTVSGWAETFTEVLGDMGIPCFTGSQTGYFSAVEIRTVLSYLQILDNPVQDIPLAAVLHSPIGKFCDEELAVIRSFSGQRYFYDCVREYLEHGEDAAIREKLHAFFEVFERLREKCVYTPVHLLLWELLDVTGYGEYAASLPAGEQRRANLDMLIEKAIAYEATSYRGLYHFVRYIENLKKYEVDYGEANLSSEADDTVRIMSIHKSKGLEFPVVFVSGLGKQFNESDIRSKVVLHPELGIGFDYVDTKLRTRQPNLLKRVIQKRTEAENLGEELRILYVAMTRAKEKLILTGSVSDAEKKMEKWMRASGNGRGVLSYAWLSSASTYLDWLMPALLPEPPSDVPFRLYTADSVQLESAELVKKSEDGFLLSALLHPDLSVCYDQAAREYLNRVFSQNYPYEKDREIIGKLSVSELKRLSHLEEDADVLELYEPESVVPLLPNFKGGQDVLTGAARGTVYHTFMENLDFHKKEELEIQLEELISCGKMTREERSVLVLSDIRRFLDSDIGKRMAEAAANNRLYRERPFVLGVGANEIRADWNPQETVLVQGIIDAYFEEEDGTISILDYKTDRVSGGRVLAERYRAQLDYYALALERLTGCRIKDKIIYSFYLGYAIVL